MPRRFVILTHDHPFLHWDLMLEDEDDLRTWRLLAQPDSTPAHIITAELLPRHRKAYLDYEGPVSGGRGTVTPWDAGEFELLVDADNELRIRLAGKKLNGVYSLLASPDLAVQWEFGRSDM